MHRCYAMIINSKVPLSPQSKEVGKHETVEIPSIFGKRSNITSEYITELLKGARLEYVVFQSSLTASFEQTWMPI